MTKLAYNRFKFKLPETPNDIQLTSLECTKKTKLPNDHTPSILCKWPKTLNTFPKHKEHSLQIGPNYPEDTTKYWPITLKTQWPKPNEKIPNYLQVIHLCVDVRFSPIKRMVIWCLKWFSLVFEWMTKNTKLP